MNTPRWKQYEINSCKFLNSNYSNLGFTFSNTGLSNSNSPDITILKNNSEIANIECKLSPSQAGQFVINNDGQKFKLSPKKFYPSNDYTDRIIGFINKHYSKYKNPSTKGINLCGCDELLYDWVINHYKNNKKSNFIISSSNIDNYNFIPVDNIREYFDISATVRNKKSGSRNISKKLYNEYKKRIISIMKNKGYSNVKINENNKKYILKLDKESTLSNDDIKFKLDKNEVYLS